jgi:hypothetical protein
LNAPSGFALYRPRRVEVRTRDGRPSRIAGSAVEAVREEWLVEDRWWTPRPLRRHYYELVVEGGRCVAVFHDLAEGGWYEQRI